MILWAGFTLLAFVLWWRVRRIERQRTVLDDWQKVLSEYHARLQSWDAELKGLADQVAQRQACTVEMIARARAEQEQALLAYGRKLASSLAEVDEDAGALLLRAVTEQVACMATTRLLQRAGGCSTSTVPR